MPINLFLDVVLEVEQKEGTNTKSFLRTLEKKKESLSITDTGKCRCRFKLLDRA